MRLYLVFILTFNIPIWAFSQVASFVTSKTISYQIAPGTISMMQIARDVYGDEKLWKEIAAWNNIRAPFPISAGQIILLHRIENLKYRVTEQAPVLSMIALENYGNLKMASLIAKWNGVSPQYQPKIGEVLILKRPPSLFLKDRRAMLLKMWRRLKRDDMVTKIENQMIPIKKSINVVSNPARPLIEKIIEKKEQPQINPPAQSLTSPVTPEVRRPASFKEPGQESYWLGDDASKIFKILSSDKKINP